MIGAVIGGVGIRLARQPELREDRAQCSISSEKNRAVRLQVVPWHPVPIIQSPVHDWVGDISFAGFSREVWGPFAS